jgi:hypothetical protein
VGGYLYQLVQPNPSQVISASICPIVTASIQDEILLVSLNG